MAYDLFVVRLVFFDNTLNGNRLYHPLKILDGNRIIVMEGVYLEVPVCF